MMNGLNFENKLTTIEELAANNKMWGCGWGYSCS